MATDTAPESTMDRLSRVMQDRQAERLSAYRQLVKDWASGDTVDVNAAAAILEAAGKSEDEFDLDVRRQMQLAKDAEVAAQAPELREEMASIAEQIAEHDATLAAAQQAHQAAVGELGTRRARLTLKLQQAESAHRRLVDTCDDPGYRGRLQDLDAQVRAANERWNLQRLRLQELESLLPRVRRRYEDAATSGSDNPRPREQFESVHQEIAQLRRTVSEARADVDRLEAERNRFRREELPRVF